MKTYTRENDITLPTGTILVGDALTRLRDLPNDSVNCCITSPPYFGLRDYGTGRWEGGDPDCTHMKGAVNHKDPRSTLVGTTTTQNHSQESWGDFCRKCGAVRVDGQIGLEPTPEAFIARLVDVFREVRRVLTIDGTCWVNMGDSYVSSPPGNTVHKWDTDGAYQRRHNRQLGHGEDREAIYVKAKSLNLKPKNLIGIPWMLAFALRADGWYLRQDIIWHKPNPMPESVTDRCTKAHEYVFMLSKSARYFYDADAIREAFDSVPEGITPLAYSKTTMAQSEREGRPGFRDSIGVSSRPKDYFGNLNGRNKRDVWSIATTPFGEAHFATFPPSLIRPMVLAGCPQGGVVLDPFLGSGTTGVVAVEEARRWIGIELNPEYATMARRRILNACPGLDF